jgi:hypothetical protein
MNPYNPDQYQTYPNTFSPSPNTIPDPAIGTTDPWEKHSHSTTGLPKRVPGSPQLRLYHESRYQGWAVSQEAHYEGLVENYLERTWGVINTALSEYSKVYAVRVDLRYPQTYPAGLNRDNHCMKRFFYHLKLEIDQSNLSNSTRLHYVWAREQRRSHNPHYHLLLLLNSSAIDKMGYYEPCDEGGYHRQNLFHRIARAWAYALGLENNQDIVGLVEYPERNDFDKDLKDAQDVPSKPRHKKHAEYKVSSNPADGYELARLYYRASYLCKAYSKRFGEVTHCFGSSRIRRR